MAIPTKDELIQWYVVEKRSYRWIMKTVGINSARTLKRLLIGTGVDIRYGGEAVQTQWIGNDERRKQTSEYAKQNLKPYWGTQSKRPEVAKKISAGKIGSKNPMWGICGEKHPNWLGGKRNWRFKRTLSKQHRQQIIDSLGAACEKCGTNQNITIHHDPPWRVCRSHDLKFLHLLCKHCHFHGPVRQR